MKKVIGFTEFTDGFTDCGRDANWSYTALKTLFNYLTETEDDCGIEIEFDPILFDYEYCYYETEELLLSDYDCDSIEELRESTTVLDCGNGEFVINTQF
jgi:hypothetical protein